MWLVCVQSLSRNCSALHEHDTACGDVAFSQLPQLGFPDAGRCLARLLLETVVSSCFAAAVLARGRMETCAHDALVQYCGARLFWDETVDATVGCPVYTCLSVLVLMRRTRVLSWQMISKFLPNSTKEQQAYKAQRQNMTMLYDMDAVAGAAGRSGPPTDPIAAALAAHGVCAKNSDSVCASVYSFNRVPRTSSHGGVGAVEIRGMWCEEDCFRLCWRTSKQLGEQMRAAAKWTQN